MRKELNIMLQSLAYTFMSRKMQVLRYSHIYVDVGIMIGAKGLISVLLSILLIISRFGDDNTVELSLT